MIFVLLLFTILNLSSAEDNGLNISPPGILVRPIGDNIVAQCTSSATPISLQWLGPMGEEITGKNESRIRITKIGSSAKMFIYNVTAMDAGNYTCSARIGGVDFIQKIELQTYQPIKFLRAPKHQELVINTTSKVYCIVIGEPPLEVEWPMIAGHLNEPSHDRILHQEDGLLINHVQPSDEGTYVCLATNNELGMMQERKIHVTVISPPTWLEQPHDVTGYIGSTLTVSCLTSGKPKPQISFYKNSAKLDNENSLRYQIDSIHGKLTIRDVRKDDEDFYKCEAVNTAGQILADFKIDLLEPPTVKRFDNATVVQGDDEVKLECMAEGDPAPNLRIVRNGKEIGVAANTDNNVVNNHLQSSSRFTHQDNSDGGRITFETQPLSTQIVNGILTIRNASRSDAGAYTCEAVNQAGQGRVTNYITVQYPPVIDKAVTKELHYLWPGHALNLTCKADSNPAALFRWFFKEKDVSTYAKFYDPRNSISKFQINHSARIYGDGEWRCEATNVYGSDVHYFNIRQAVPPQPLSTAQFWDVSPTTVRFTVPLEDLYHSSESPILNVSHINVHYRTMDQSPDEASSRHQIKAFSIGGPYILSDLIPDTHYILTFQLVNPVGNSSLSREFRVQTAKQSPPYPPRIISPSEVDVKSNMNERNADGSHLSADNNWIDVNKSPNDQGYPYHHNDDDDNNHDSKGEDGKGKRESYTLVWKEPLDGGRPINVYEIQWIRGYFDAKTNGSTLEQDRFRPYTSDASYLKEGTAKAPTNNYYIDGLEPGSVYKIMVRAANVIGLSEWDTVYVNVKSDGTNIQSSRLYKETGKTTITRGIWIALICMVCFMILILADVYCYCIKQCGLIMLVTRKVLNSGKYSGKNYLKEVESSQTNSPKSEDTLATTVPLNGQSGVAAALKPNDNSRRGGRDAINGSSSSPSKQANKKVGAFNLFFGGLNSPKRNNLSASNKESSNRKGSTSPPKSTQGTANGIAKLNGNAQKDSKTNPNHPQSVESQALVDINNNSHQNNIHKNMGQPATHATLSIDDLMPSSERSPMISTTKPKV